MCKHNSQVLKIQVCLSHEPDEKGCVRMGVEYLRRKYKEKHKFVKIFSINTETTQMLYMFSLL